MQGKRDRGLSAPARILGGKYLTGSSLGTGDGRLEKKALGKLQLETVRGSRKRVTPDGRGKLRTKIRKKKINSDD